MDSLTRLQVGIDHARPIIAATTPDDYARPTPCEAWTVRELINHMLGALTMFRDVAVQGVADPAVFARVNVGQRGRSLEWPGEIDFRADALWFESHLEDAPHQPSIAHAT